jgi:hypothetical protein
MNSESSSTRPVRKRFTKRKLIIAAIAAVVLIAGVVVAIILLNNNKPQEDAPEEEDLDSYELEFGKPGVVVKSPFTKDKETDTFEITNIIISKDKNDVFISADVKNKTDSEIPADSIADVILQDKDRKEVGRVETKLKAMKPGASTSIKVEVSKYYGDTRTFTIELKQ